MHGTSHLRYNPSLWKFMRIWCAAKPHAADQTMTCRNCEPCSAITYATAAHDFQSTKLNPLSGQWGRQVSVLTPSKCNKYKSTLYDGWYKQARVIASHVTTHCLGLKALTKYDNNTVQTANHWKLSKTSQNLFNQLTEMGSIMSPYRNDVTNRWTQMKSGYCYICLCTCEKGRVWGGR